jgi:hypothetical protein
MTTNNITGCGTEAYIPIASPIGIGSLNGSGPKAPTTNSSRWSKACDWVKAHQKELSFTAGVICTLIGVALVASFFIAIAVEAAPVICTALLFSYILVAPGFIVWGGGLVYDHMPKGVLDFFRVPNQLP